ncbi:uncharacterized protein METZ01_LOCUS269039, partial [marine metagenome]
MPYEVKSFTIVSNTTTSLASLEVTPMRVFSIKLFSIL